MFRRTHVFGSILLSACAVQQERELPQGIWHESEQLGQFSETWSSCHHFRATTPDLRWMLDIDVSIESGMFKASRLVTLLDFSHFIDRECGVSLYKKNDTACENNEPVRIPASDGDGRVLHSKKIPDWESTFDLDIHNLILGFSELNED